MKPEDLVVGNFYSGFFKRSNLIFIECDAVNNLYRFLNTKYKIVENYRREWLECLTELKSTIEESTPVEPNIPQESFVGKSNIPEPTIREYRTVEGHPIEIGKVYQTRGAGRVIIEHIRNDYKNPIKARFLDAKTDWMSDIGFFIHNGRMGDTTESYDDCINDIMRPWPEEKVEPVTDSDQLKECPDCKESNSVISSNDLRTCYTCGRDVTKSKPKAHDPSKMWKLYYTLDMNRVITLFSSLHFTKEDALLKKQALAKSDLVPYALVQGILTPFDKGDGLNE